MIGEWHSILNECWEMNVRLPYFANGLLMTICNVSSLEGVKPLLKKRVDYPDLNWIFQGKSVFPANGMFQIHDRYLASPAINDCDLYKGGSTNVAQAQFFRASTKQFRNFVVATLYQSNSYVRVSLNHSTFSRSLAVHRDKSIPSDSPFQYSEREPTHTVLWMGSAVVALQ